MGRRAQVETAGARAIRLINGLTHTKGPFAALCELQATLNAASAQKDAEAFAPFTVADDYNGVPTVKVHAALKLERETAQAIRPYYALFGLEPVSRARIAVPPAPEEPTSKWAGALK